MTSTDTLAMVRDLIDRNLAGPVPCMAIAAAPAATLAAAAGTVLGLTQDLPGTVHWWLMKSGRAGADQLAIRALAIGLGGHVRVGFEDMVHTYDDAGLAPSNAWYVARMVELARYMGRAPATPGQTRELLELA